MPVLADVDLRELLDKGSLVIEPFNEERITAAGYNLSAGSTYLSKKSLKQFQLSPGGNVSVPPGETIAIRTLERLELSEGRDISGMVQSKIRMINAGFAQISTTLDPDHKGHLFVTLQNLSSYPSSLTYGQPICTVVFLKNLSPSQKTANNSYDEHEIVESILNAWKAQRPAVLGRLWQRYKPFLPIVFVLVSGGLALTYFGKTPAFGGVMAAVAAVAMLLDRIISGRRGV